MTFPLMNFTMTSALADPTSYEWRSLALPFCDYVSIYYRLVLSPTLANVGIGNHSKQAEICRATDFLGSSEIF